MAGLFLFGDFGGFGGFFIPSIRIHEITSRPRYPPYIFYAEHYEILTYTDISWIILSNRYQIVYL